MTDTELPSGVRPPRQRRSREAMDRILEATAELLVERGFSEISVAEITSRAGVSVGSFYARFADKDVVLRTLEEQMRSRAETSAELALGPQRWDGVPVDAFIRQFVREFLETDRINEGLLRAFALQAQTDPDYRPSYLIGREKVLGRFRDAFVDRVVERRTEVGHASPARAARLCFDVLVALTERRLFLPGPDLDADELADLLLAHLGVDVL